MSLFRRPKRKMDPRMFIICDTKDDLKNLWMWAYEHNYLDPSSDNYLLLTWLDLYDKYMTNDACGLKIYVDDEAPMFMIEPGKGLKLFGHYNDMRENMEEEYQYYRKHAMHARDIDFDFLTPIL